MAVELTRETGFTNVSFVIKNGTQLSVLQSSQGTDLTIAQLVVLIADFNSNFNVYKPMNDDQILKLANDLIIEYWEYTIEDFICFFHLLSRGELEDQFVRIKDRIDMQLVHFFLKKYDEKRLKKIYEMNEEYKLSSPNISEKAVDVPSGSMTAIAESLINALKSGQPIKPMSREETEKLWGKKISDETWEKIQEDGKKK